MTGVWVVRRHIPILKSNCELNHSMKLQVYGMSEDICPHKTAAANRTTVSRDKCVVCQKTCLHNTVAANKTRVSSDWPVGSQRTHPDAKKQL